MVIRRATFHERTMLRPARHAFIGPHRHLDADEQRELVHLYRTRQATAEDLAARFGISRRTVYRYVATLPDQYAYESAAKRLHAEAARAGITLTRDDAVRLTVAALTVPA